MRVIRNNRQPVLSDSSIVTIGNFDGVHQGHQALIKRCRERAGAGAEVAVVTFEPLPQVWFRPQQAPARLTGPQQKLRLLEEAGVDLVWVMRFDQELAELTARAFISTVICDSLRANAVVVGQDFRFGKSREGDLQLLMQFGQEFGFDVEGLADVELDGERVSSSAVRRALAAGEFRGAARLLGREFTIEGEVIAGQQLGHGLGYPTANIRPETLPCPLSGVFAVRCKLRGTAQWLDGVANLGTRPAVGGGEFLVEVHIFDFDDDLYGQDLEVAFVGKIRNELDFRKIEELKARMSIDETLAREMLATKQ